jgi:hypothetical protein
MARGTIITRTLKACFREQIRTESDRALWRQVSTSAVSGWALAASQANPICYPERYPEAKFRLLVIGFFDLTLLFCWCARQDSNLRPSDS